MAQKQVYLGQLGQKQVHTKIKSKAHPTSHAIGPKRIVPVFRRTKPRYTWVCLLCLTFNCFLSFCSQSEALHTSTLRPPYECRRTGRPPPPSKRRHTSDTRVCLYTSAEIHRYDIRIPTCTMATDGSASAACEIEVGLIYPTMQTR